MYKVGRIANHRAVNALQPSLLIGFSSLRTLRLMEAAREPLQPDVAGACHGFGSSASAAWTVVMVSRRLQCILELDNELGTI